jgi:predicted permease
MGSIPGDIRLAFRQILKERAFTLTVLLTLAVCVGANAAIFSVVHTVLLSPLPFPEADRLVSVNNSYPGAGAERGSTGSFDYFGRRDRIQAFEEMAQFQSWGHTVGEPGSTERLRTMRVTPSFFPLLGVQPTIGRGFREAEMDPGNEAVVVLTHDFWQSHFDGDPGVLDRDLRIDSEPYRVVGVLPAGFRLPQNTQPSFFVPIPYSAQERTIDNWHSNNFQMMARLRPGFTIERAQAENDALNAAFIAEWPVPNAAQLLEDAGYEMLIEPMQEGLVRNVKPTLYLLWGGVVFVLLIGCVNIANLILARAQVRIREMATRLAIGARRVRIIREVLTHALLLAVVGGALGVGVGFGGIRLLSALGASQLPRGSDISMDPAVLLFTLGIALGAGLIFGAIPSLHLLRADLRSVLHAESRGSTGDRRTLWIRTSLVTAQIALAFVLLIGAGLMLTSFRSAVSVESGFRSDGVLTARVSLPAARYSDSDSRIQFADAMVAELDERPGVRAVGITSQLPFSGSNSSSVILPEGYLPPPGESVLSPFQTWVAGDYFDAMGIPLLEGRLFEPADGTGDRRVIVLDEWLARRYFGDESPLGKRMLWATVPGMEEEDDFYTVVGVVGTIKHNDLTESAGEHVGAYYFPYRQNANAFVTIVAALEGDPLAFTAPLRDVLRRRDAELPLFDIATMQSRVDDSLSNRRATMFIFVMFAGVALFLAVVGIYGVLAYTVAQRSRELGIRMALGSSTREIFVLVLRHGLKVTGFGLVAGGAAAALLGGVIRSLLYGVQPLDPAVILTVAGLLGLVAIAASTIPAMRASRLNPVRALVGE